MMISDDIEEIDDKNNKICYGLQNDDTSGCRLVEMLEENLNVLRVESRQIAQINADVGTKLRNFKELSNSITSKLQSLMTLSDLRFGVKDEIKEFVERITLSWLRTNEQIIKEHSRIRLASRTSIGTPLSIILEKKKKESAAIKISLEIGSVIYDQDYVDKGYRIYDDISQILDNLERCDDKVQQYMVMCKTMPYLVELSSTIDRFVSTTVLLPSPIIRSFSSNEDLTVFKILSKLLTGELFGHEPANPRKTLAENAPRKPVFITLNNKRKNEISKISKVSRIASFPSYPLKSKYTKL